MIELIKRKNEQLNLIQLLLDKGDITQVEYYQWRAAIFDEFNRAKMTKVRDVRVLGQKFKR